MNVGDKVRLRDGVLPWITKRDGWVVESSEIEGTFHVERDGVHCWIYPDDIEPESPPIPLEPPRVVGQTWRTANGAAVVTVEEDDGENGYDAYLYVDEYGESWRTYSWHDLAHPLTPLYPVPDPDDDDAVWAMADRTRGKGSDDLARIRAVLRALREESLIDSSGQQMTIRDVREGR
jgi:hypothetical protein